MNTMMLSEPHVEDERLDMEELIEELTRAGVLHAGMGIRRCGDKIVVTDVSFPGGGSAIHETTLLGEPARAKG